MTCENHFRCDKISASSLVAACVRICDKSLRQNLNQPMRKHQLVSRHVKFELVYISSLPKSIACTEQVSYRRYLSQHQCRRGDLSPRCVAAICRIVCLGLYRPKIFLHKANFPCLTYVSQSSSDTLPVAYNHIVPTGE